MGNNEEVDFMEAMKEFFDTEKELNNLKILDEEIGDNCDEDEQIARRNKIDELSNKLNTIGRMIRGTDDSTK